MIVLVFILGLITGSFLNSVIYSLETGKNLVVSRSHCPNCKKELGFWDLVPVFSFLFLRGRCRYCNEKISWQYPLVELLTSLMFVLVFMMYSNSIFIGYYLVLTCLLVPLFVFDLKHYLLPDILVYIGSILSLGFVLWQMPIVNHLLSASIFSLFFGLIYLVSKGKWLGFGDVKLAFLMGLVLGFPKTLVAFFLSTFIGALVGIALIALEKKGWKSQVPFGPFLIGGMMIALFWGQWLVRFYLDIMGI